MENTFDPTSSQTPNLSKTSFLLRSLAIGWVATNALDWISTAIYENEDPALREEENATRGHQAYEKAVDRLARQFGVELSEEQIKYWGWKFHRSFGILGGMQYLALRRKFPKMGWGWGLAFGTAFFLVADEFLIYVFKLVPGPTKFSWKVHARGAVAHIAYGVAAETTARALDRVAA